MKKVYEIWCCGMIDGIGRYYLRTLLDKKEAQDWCDKQFGVMGTRPPNNHHWVEERNISKAEYQKYIDRNNLIKKISTVLTDDEMKLLGIRLH